MELYASTVKWDGGGKLTVYDKTQGVQNVQRYVCSVFDMKPDDVRVMSPFVGGAFGSGLRPQFQVVLAVLAPRAGAFGASRADTPADVRARLSARHDPADSNWAQTPMERSTAITHDAITVTSQYEDFYRQETGWSGLLYKSANAEYAHKLAHLDLSTSCDMRAPSAATGVYALEWAMDELAVALKIDPLDLALRCYSERDQNTDRPYSSKNLRACYHQGAEAFGWNTRNPEPRSMRDGTELIGWGMATGVWEALQMPAAVRIVLDCQRTRGDRLRDIRHRYRHLHDHGAGSGRHARPAD